MEFLSGLSVLSKFYGWCDALAQYNIDQDDLTFTEASRYRERGQTCKMININSHAILSIQAKHA